MVEPIDRPSFQPVPADPVSFEVTDPEAFREMAARGVNHRMVVQGRGPYRAARWRSTSPMLIASRGHTNLAVTHHTGTGDLAFFTFVAEDDPTSVMHGQPLQPGALAWCRANAEIHSQSPAGATWSNLCFPTGMVEQDWTALFGTPFAGPAASVEVVPVPPEVQQQIKAGLGAALSANEHAPTLVHGLLRLLLERFVHDEGTEQAAHPGLPPRLARQVRTADGLVAIADSAAVAYPLAAVCAQLGVSLRTLNASSRAVLGMGAGQYLRRRRLHRVLAMLRTGEGSVTEAATAQGFWDLGRFGGDYRSLFGCYPSETLRQGSLRSAAGARAGVASVPNGVARGSTQA